MYFKKSLRYCCVVGMKSYNSKIKLWSLISSLSLQGCMNNITFGDDKFGHYETVAGGAGAVSLHHRFLEFKKKIFQKYSKNWYS